MYAPHSGDQLVLIEIYQSSGTFALTPAGDVYTPIRGTWVLTANTQGAPSNTGPAETRGQPLLAVTYGSSSFATARTTSPIRLVVLRSG